MARNLLSSIKDCALRLVRCALRPTARRGFGIQSPWAFHLVRDIVGAKYPYYAYEQLAAAHPALSNKQRMHYELLFRLANYCQPDAFIEQTGDTVACEYVAAACRNAQCTMHNAQCTIHNAQCTMHNAQSVILWHCDIDNVCVSDFESIAPDSLLVVEGINRDHETKNKWKALMDSPLVSVTFDMRRFAIVSFNPKRPKQHFFI